MKKWLLVLLSILLMLAGGCRPDPDILLEKGESAEQEATVNDTEETVDQLAEEKSESIKESPEADEQDSEICAYICGAVCNPGVYELDADSRVFHLVELAGGMLEDADEKSVNMAQILSDGQMIWIPTKEEALLGEISPSMASEQDGTDSGRININTAAVEELMELNGIGEMKAEAIVAYREEHGPFASEDDIMQVSGIGQGTFEKIKDEITV